MSEDNAGKVIQYYWAGERQHRKDVRKEEDLAKARNNICNRPIKGMRWRYYPNTEANRLALATMDDPDAASFDYLETDGRVISYNQYNGVVITDAGEILIRG